MKRLALALMLSIAVLAGCGQGTKTPQTTPAQPQAKAAELTLLTWFGIPREAIDEYIDWYETKHPGTKIKVKEMQGRQVMGQDGKINPSAFEGADVLLMPSDTALMFHSEGLVRDLSQVRMPQADPAIAAVWDELATVDGKRIAIPISITPSLMTINLEQFQKANLPAPAVDWTVEEFEQALAALKAAGIPYNLDVQFALEPLVGAYGGSLYDVSRQAWAFDSAEAKQGLSYVGRLTQAGLVTATASAGNKTVVMIGGGPNGPALSALPAKGGVSILPGMNLQPYPKGPKGRAVPVSAIVGVVAKQSASPEAATDFLKEMVSSPEAQLALAKGGIRPVISDAGAMAAWQEAVGDRVAQAMDVSLEGAYVATQPTGWRDLLSGLQPFFDGQSGLDELLPGLMARLQG